MIRSNFVHFNTQNRLWYVCTTSFSFLTAGTSENTKAQVTITTATVHSNTGIKPKWVYKGKRGRACVCSLFFVFHRYTWNTYTTAGWVRKKTGWWLTVGAELLDEPCPGVWPWWRYRCRPLDDRDMPLPSCFLGNNNITTFKNSKKQQNSKCLKQDLW